MLAKNDGKHSFITGLWIPFDGRGFWLLITQPFGLQGLDTSHLKAYLKLFKMSGEPFLWVQGLWSYKENIKMAAFSSFIQFFMFDSRLQMTTMKHSNGTRLAWLLMGRNLACGLVLRWSNCIQKEISSWVMTKDNEIRWGGHPKPNRCTLYVKPVEKVWQIHIVISWFKIVLIVCNLKICPSLRIWYSQIYKKKSRINC